MHMADSKNHNNGQKGSTDKSDLIWKALADTSTPEELEKYKELSRRVDEHNKRVLEKWKKNDSESDSD